MEDCASRYLGKQGEFGKKIWKLKLGKPQILCLVKLEAVLHWVLSGLTFRV